MYEIRPVPKHYAWGSSERLQELFHTPRSEYERSIAEMWFSGHEQSPSMVVTDEGEVPLTQMISEHPDDMVGEAGSSQFGPVLPYLFKIIAAEQPLSLQVHPVDFQARAGFNMENQQGIALDAPERSFKDMNAKSEMIVALEPFSAVVGFASRSQAIKNLSACKSAVAQRMVRALQGQLDAQECAVLDEKMPVSAIVWSESRKRIFRAFSIAVTGDDDGTDIEADLVQARALLEHPRAILSFDFALQATRAFPHDMSVYATLMMNPVQLDEGESVFLPTGVPHAYIHGLGAEIMTNSDNVLRAGMTVKHKDIDQLLQCVDCKAASPVDPSDSRTGALLMSDVVFYKPNVEEYILAYGHVDAAHEPWQLGDKLARKYDALVAQINGRGRFPHNGPRVIVCTQGAIQCEVEGETRVLQQGDAVFVPAKDGWCKINAVVDGEGPSQGSYLMASTPF